MRQVAISHYIKAWDTGQWLFVLDPVRMHWSSRCAAARTCCTMWGSARSRWSLQITFCLARARWFSSARLYNLPSFAMLRSVSPAAYPSPNPDLTLACATSRARDECAHFCLWTGWATQRVSIPTELSFTRCRLTPSALILLAGSSVVKGAPVRLLGQGKGDGKYAR